MAASHQHGRLTWTVPWMNLIICTLLCLCVYERERENQVIVAVRDGTPIIIPAVQTTPITDTTTQMLWHRTNDYPRVLYQIMWSQFNRTLWRPLSTPLLSGPRPFTLWLSSTPVLQVCYRNMNVHQAFWSTSCGWTKQHSYIKAPSTIISYTGAADTVPM